MLKMALFLPSIGSPFPSLSPASRCIARERLHEAKYMLDVIGESFIDFARLKELTNLAEGEVYSLKKFAVEWSGQVASKRARRRL
jgi:hypothetical protein